MTEDNCSNRFPITMPDLGTGNEAVRVSAWLVEVGQTVIAGDRVVEVLLPGITFDIHAERTGELVEITVPVDAVVAAGQVLGWIAGDA
jgi:pyruvate/2-oxoglutarate dehydrogenase complex dihydrolipoamide acyltransferase (E2) component